MNLAIEVNGLTKSYRTKSGDTVDAVKGIDLHVTEGEILAFLGSNGAGKTTTIEILEGFRERTAGDVLVLGQDPHTAPRSWREDIGIVLQESQPDADLTAHEAVTMYASYYNAPRPVDEVLQIAGLGDSAGQRTKALSGGQKRRLDLAIALVGDPKLIFLDEPTTGFDPSARREAWEMIEQLRNVGATVLLTTHYMDEAEHLADRIVVISGGLIAAEGTAADLADQVKLLTRIAWDPAEVPIDAVPEPFRASLVTAVDGLSIETTEVTAVVHALATWATSNDRRLDSLSVMRPNLEDTFLRLTDQGKRPMITKTFSAAKYALLSFRRNPAATFFTVVFPVMFLVIFGFVFGNEDIESGGRTVEAATFIVPGILVLSIVSATFVNLAMGQVFRREFGQLKRLRGTPLAPTAYLIGQILASLVIVVFMTVLVTVIGRLFFGVTFNLSSIGVFALGLAIGSISFSALGLAVTAIIPNQDSAPAFTNAIVFPLYFVSDVFIFTDDDSTGFFSKIGDFFPIKPLNESLRDSYNPFIESVSIPWGKWAVVAAWGLFGVLAAVKFFKWVPQTERR